jgi:flavin reductase (DIM6/NTAB) family NADH-FMN oxidoreductase RutF
LATTNINNKKDDVLNIHLSSLSGTGVYHLMTQPIAWVLTQNNDESLNLAPFSYFNAVCSDPPLMMLSMGKKPDGNAKDTATNLLDGAYCVVHIAHVEQAELVTATAASLKYGESEVDNNNVALQSHQDWPLPKIAGCPIAYLCKVHSRTSIGNTAQQLVFVEALELYVDDAAVTQSEKRISIDALAIDPLARLGASQYANLGEVFSKARPK